MLCVLWVILYFFLKRNGKFLKKKCRFLLMNKFGRSCCLFGSNRLLILFFWLVWKILLWLFGRNNSCRFRKFSYSFSVYSVIVVVL